MSNTFLNFKCKPINSHMTVLDYACRTEHIGKTFPHEYAGSRIRARKTGSISEGRMQLSKMNTDCFVQALLLFYYSVIMDVDIMSNCITLPKYSR